MSHCLFLFSILVFSDLLPPFLNHTTHKYHNLPESFRIGLCTPSQYAMSIDIRKRARIFHTLKYGQVDLKGQFCEERNKRKFT